ncbi:MAG TPA: replication-relaxation family protein [Blastocatellia bacterium]|nr:replication-relaxation family protein [Blastocatellia bacterium]
MSVQITPRDLQLLQTLNAAGWLNTRQIRDRFFPGKSTNAVCKRLRKLVAGKYIGIARHNSTEHALYRLARRGRLALIERTDLEAEAVAIPTEVPRKLNHFMAINDLRFCFEQLNGAQGARLVFFFSERELALYRYGKANNADAILRLLSSHRLIPDALARISIDNQGSTRDIDVAIEFGAGTEHPGFSAGPKSCSTQRWRHTTIGSGTSRC